MATAGTKLALLLGLEVAGSLLATAQPDDPPGDKPDTNKPTVTINNPSLLPLDIMTNAKNVRVITESATLDINHQEQRLKISAGGGGNMDVTVHDGDVLTVMADQADAKNTQAFKVVVSSEEPQPYDVAVGDRPYFTSRKVLPQANEPWPEMHP